MDLYQNDEEFELQEEEILDGMKSSQKAQFQTNSMTSLMQSFFSELNINNKTMGHLPYKGTGLTEALAQVALTEPHLDYDLQSQTQQIDWENFLQQSSCMKVVKVATKKRKIQKVKRRYSINHQK